MRVLFFDEGDVDGGSELTLFCTPILLDVVCELLNFGFICFVFSVRNYKASILSFIFEEVLLCTRVYSVHMVVNIFDPLHFWHVLDVVDHVEIQICRLAFIFRVPFLFFYFNRLGKLDE